MDKLETRSITAGGMTLQYAEVGEGPPVICIHGGGPGAESLTSFTRNVGALQGDFRVILLDLPRFGGSEKVITDEPRLGLYARAISGFVEALDLPPVSFVGNSMGGQAAMRFAIDHPGRVRAIVAIGSTPIRDGGISPMPAEGVRLLQQYYASEGPSVAKMRQLIGALVYDTSLITDELVQARYEASVRPDLLDMHAPENPRPALEWLDGQLERIAAPVLLIWGSEDRAGPIDVGLRMVRQIPDARMYIFNRCGHWAQAERADEFNRVVRDFLTASTPREVA